MNATIVFDLDGTLSNPLVGISRSLNHALEHYGHPPVTSVRAAECIGPPLDEAFRSLTKVRDDSRIAALVAKYRERYAEVGYSENVLYPGVREALEVLREREVVMGVCTSKRADFAVRILEMFDIRAFFLFVEGGDVGIQKWQMLEGLRRKGLVSEGATMVGDRSIDLIAARRNGLDAGGVLWGFGSRPELETERPRYLFSSPDEWIALR